MKQSSNTLAYIEGAYDERAQIVADLRNEANRANIQTPVKQKLNALAEKYEKAAHLSHLKIRPVEEKTGSQSMDSEK